MTSTTFVFLAVLGFASAFKSMRNVSISRTSNGGVFTPGDIIFQDDFESLNRDVWHNENYMGGSGNNEFQIYSDYPENAYVRDGILYIKPTLSLDTIFGGNYEKLYNGYFKLKGCTDAKPNSDACQRQGKYPNILPPVVSARLRTKGSFSFRYGRVEIKAKMSAGDWTWPAIWMLPEDWKYGGWPASGEIDIIESRGNRKLENVKGKQIGSERVGSTVHYGPYWPHNGWWAASGERLTATDKGYEGDFHIYEFIWTSEYIQFKVDGNDIVKVVPPKEGFFELGQFPKDIPNPWLNAENLRMAPFDTNFHFILNVAVGGSFFPGDSKPSPPWGRNPFLDFFRARDTWNSSWKGEHHAMAVDYIRVYAI